LQNSRDSLKDRLDSVLAVFIVRRAEDSGQKQLNEKLAKARAISYEKHLTLLGIAPKDYDRVYELAVQAYTEDGVKGPFGIDEILVGARKFLAQTFPTKVFTKERKEKNDCATCHSTGLQFDSQGKIIYEILEGKKQAKRCLDCYEQ